jgi:hypothetical protein
MSSAQKENNPTPVVPNNTDQRVVFTYSRILRRFRIPKDTFIHISGLAEREEVEKVLNDLSYFVKSYRRRQTTRKLKIGYCLLCICMLIACLITIVVMVTQSDSSNSELNVGLLLGVIGGIISLCFILMLIAGRLFSIKPYQIYSDLTGRAMIYINERKRQWQMKGLKWVIPSNHFPLWVELIKDDSQNQTTFTEINYSETERDISTITQSTGRLGTESLLNEDAYLFYRKKKANLVNQA